MSARSDKVSQDLGNLVFALDNMRCDDRPRFGTAATSNKDVTP